MKEKEIENQILNWLMFVPDSLFFKNQSVGIFDPIKRVYRKNTNRHHINGTSDILGVCKGRFIAIEVKAKRGKPTENQTRFIDRVNNHGGLAFIARSIDEVKDRLIKEKLYDRKDQTAH